MFNLAVLMGRLTAAPELKATQSGTPVTTFTIAVNRRYKAKDGEQQADFINCVAWRKTAEFITKYFSKGDAITIRGEIQTRKYKDRDGNSRTAFEIKVDDATFCGGKSGGNTDDTTQGAPVFEDIDNDEELPF